MSSLQAVAMGLVIVFLDVGSGGWDWIADPFGWVLVLFGLAPVKDRLAGHRGAVVSAWVCLVVSLIILPPDSVDTIDPTLGWLFSLPTIAFCFVLCDAVTDTPDESLPPGRAASLKLRFRWLRVAFVVVGLLPVLVYLVGWDWLTIPTAVAAVLTNLTLVFSLWAAGDEPEETETSGTLAKLRERQQAKAGEKVTEKPKRTPERPEKASTKDQETPKEGGFDAEAVKRRVRREREAWKKKQQKGE